MKENNNDNIQSDLLTLALMFIIAVYILTIFPVQLINKNKAHKELLQAKEIAVYYYDRSIMLEDTRTSLNNHITYQDSIIEQQNSLLSEKDKIGRILKDLSQDTQKKIK